MCSGAQRSLTSSHRPLELQHVWGHRGPKRFHRRLDLQDIREQREVSSGPIDHYSYKIFGGTEVPSGPTDRQSCKNIGGTEKFQAVPQRSQLVPQTAGTATSSGAKRGLTSSHRPHRPLELQHVPGHREVPLIPRTTTCASLMNTVLCLLYSVSTLPVGVAVTSNGI
jgi:hypothetical protein